MGKRKPRVRTSDHVRKMVYGRSYGAIDMARHVEKDTQLGLKRTPSLKPDVPPKPSFVPQTTSVRPLNKYTY